METNKCCLDPPREDIPDTCNHGTEVFQLILGSAPEATFHLLRVTELHKINGKDIKITPAENLLRAFDKAIELDLDILNLSQGIPEPKIGEINIIPDKVQEVIDAGVSVIASSGNKNIIESEKHLNETFHPARLDDVICVSGLIPKCTADSPKAGDNNSGPLWTYLTSTNELIGPYCSQRGCVNGEDCSNNCERVNWSGNVEPIDNNPDVYAPAHFFARCRGGGYAFKCGTSYSAPIVTGAMATLISEVPSIETSDEIQELLTKHTEHSNHIDGEIVKIELPTTI